MNQTISCNDEPLTVVWKSDNFGKGEGLTYNGRCVVDQFRCNRIQYRASAKLDCGSPSLVPRPFGREKRAGNFKKGEVAL